MLNLVAIFLQIRRHSPGGLFHMQVEGLALKPSPHLLNDTTSEVNTTKNVVHRRYDEGLSTLPGYK